VLLHRNRMERAGESTSGIGGSACRMKVASVFRRRGFAGSVAREIPTGASWRSVHPIPEVDSPAALHRLR